MSENHAGKESEACYRELVSIERGTVPEGTRHRQHAGPFVVEPSSILDGHRSSRQEAFTRFTYSKHVAFSELPTHGPAIAVREERANIEPRKTSELRNSPRNRLIPTPPTKRIMGSRRISHSCANKPWSFGRGQFVKAFRFSAWRSLELP
jgi:hypothetical protein